MKLKIWLKRLFCGNLILWILVLWWSNFANSTEICKNSQKILTFAVGTSCCHDNHCTQGIKATEIDISNHEIQENLKTKL